MSMKHSAPTSPDRVDGVFLRAIGRLSLASFELAAIRVESDATHSGRAAWNEFADHLADAAEAVREGACGSSFPGNTIAILRHGVRVPVDVDYVDRLAEKIDRHIRVGRALGVDEPETSGVTLSA